MQDSQGALAITRDPQRRRNELDASALFDTIFASQQITLQPAPIEQGAVPDPRAARVDDAGAPPMIDRARSPSRSEPISLDTHAHEPAPADAQSEATRTSRRFDPVPLANRANHDDPMIHQGTLPVIVAGQLVELTVLRERRAHDAAPTRRLTMTLRPASAAELRVEAHLDGDRLFVQFAGTGGEDAKSCAHYADEVRALAHRLGWTFTEMSWGVA